MRAQYRFNQFGYLSPGSIYDQEGGANLEGIRSPEHPPYRSIQDTMIRFILSTILAQNFVLDWKEAACYGWHTNLMRQILPQEMRCLLDTLLANTVIDPDVVNRLIGGQLSQAERTRLLKDTLRLENDITRGTIDEAVNRYAIYGGPLVSFLACFISDEQFWRRPEVWSNNNRAAPG